MKFLKRWFRDLVSERVVLDVHPAPVNPTPVHLDSAAIAQLLSLSVRKDVDAALRQSLDTALGRVSEMMPKPEPLPPIPPPVVDVEKLISGMAEQLYSVMDAKLVDTVNAALKPRLPEQPLDKQGNPTYEGKLLSLLPSDVQKAARFGCRHVQSESRFPVGGKVLGHNFHRDEACERAMTWLQERCIQYRTSDVHLACELYYRVYVRENKA